MLFVCVGEWFDVWFGLFICLLYGSDLVSCFVCVLLLFTLFCLFGLGFVLVPFNVLSGWLVWFCVICLIVFARLLSVI